MKGSKVDMLPGLVTTPRVLLEKMIERADRIQQMVIIEFDKEGDTHVYHTQMTRGDAVWLQHAFNEQWLKTKS